MLRTKGKKTAIQQSHKFYVLTKRRIPRIISKTKQPEQMLFSFLAFQHEKNPRGKASDRLFPKTQPRKPKRKFRSFPEKNAEKTKTEIVIRKLNIICLIIAFCTYKTNPSPFCFFFVICIEYLVSTC